MSIVEVPMSDLLRVLPFKGRDDVRYYLNGVLVTPYNGGALLVATNGHWVAVYESKAARTDQDRILDIPHWFARQLAHCAARAGDDDEDDEGWSDETLPPRSESALTLTVKDPMARIVVNAPGQEMLVKPGIPFLDGKFPDWRKVLPAPEVIERGLMAPVAPYYLSALHKAVPDEYQHALFCYHQRDNAQKGCVLFRFGNMPELVIALMPRNDADCAPTEWPKWMAKEPAA